jgi:hypothetical protein
MYFASPPKSAKKSKKTVNFAVGTAPPVEVPIALTFTNHEVYERFGHVVYFIDCWQYPTKWTITKRYSEFLALDKALVELVKDVEGFRLPKLPGKRVFELKRWINRFDPEYTYKRQQGLQRYLKRLIHNQDLLRYSKHLQNFLIMVKIPAPNYTDEMKNYEIFKKNSIIYYPPIELEEDSHGQHSDHDSDDEDSMEGPPLRVYQELFKSPSKGVSPGFDKHRISHEKKSPTISLTSTREDDLNDEENEADDLASSVRSPLTDIKAEAKNQGKLLRSRDEVEKETLSKILFLYLLRCHHLICIMYISVSAAAAAGNVLRRHR